MFKDLSLEERKVLLIWSVIGFIIFLVAVFFKIFIVNDIELKKYDTNYTIVKDYSRYYTVNSAITKYYAFINSKNYKSVINILDSKYVEDNKINAENINNFITISDIAISYKPGIMCSKDIKKGITSYLVEGTEAGMNNAKEIGKVYYEVILDGNNLIFSLKPISEENYGGNCNG